MRTLGADLDVVVHAGAWVDLAYPYGVLKPVNVGSAARLLDVVAASGARLVHVSTLSVFGGRGASEDLVVGAEPAAHSPSGWPIDSSPTRSGPGCRLPSCARDGCSPGPPVSRTRTIC